MDPLRKPSTLRSNNGPEFTAQAVREWLKSLGVRTLFIEPGSPWENGCIESLNGKLRNELLDLMIEDIRVYSRVSAAYSMPKDTPDQKESRSEAIQTALKAAMQPPLRAAICCHRILKLNESLVDKGNANLISDVGVAVLLAEAAMRSAFLNVQINLSYIEDENLCRDIRKKLDPMLSEAEELRARIYGKVNEAIGS